MPGAPASRQASTASSTRGSRPPRELRSVATLLTFTLSFAMSAEVFLDDVDDFLRPAVDLVLTFALEHHAQQRFGAGVANQQPPLAGDPRFDPLDRLGH